MTEVSDGIWLGISLIFIAAVVGIAVYFMQLGRRIGNSYEEESRIAEQLQGYRKFEQYDGKEVFQLDAAALVMESAGTLSISVDSPAIVWNALSPSAMFRIDYVTEQIPASAVYICSTVKDGNGVLSGFNLRRV